MLIRIFKILTLPVLLVGCFGGGNSSNTAKSASVVASSSKSCPVNPKACSDHVVCTGARTKPYYSYYSAPYWSKMEAFQPYVKEAIARSLSCSGY